MKMSLTFQWVVLISLKGPLNFLHSAALKGFFHKRAQMADLQTRPFYSVSERPWQLGLKKWMVFDQL